MHQDKRLESMVVWVRNLLGSPRFAVWRSHLSIRLWEVALPEGGNPLELHTGQKDVAPAEFKSASARTRTR